MRLTGFGRYVETKRSRNTHPIPQAILCTSFRVKRSKVKVTNWTAYKVQSWYTDGARRPVSPTSAMTSKVKGQDRKVTWSVRQVLAHKSRTKCPRNTNIGRKVAHPTGNNAHQVRCQKVKGKITRPINAEIESVSPTNFKLGRRLVHVLSTAMASYRGLWSCRNASFRKEHVEMLHFFLSSYLSTFTGVIQGLMTSKW